MKLNCIPVLVILLFSQCSKKDSQNQQNSDFFPPVNVDFTVNLSLPSYAGLNFPNGFAYEDNYGYRGVVIYNTGFSGPEQYVAFDRACPYKPDSSCSKVSIDSTNIYLRCGQLIQNKFTPCCNSSFFALNGSYTSGAAKRNLRQYFVYQFGANTLRISSVPK